MSTFCSVLMIKIQLHLLLHFHYPRKACCVVFVGCCTNQFVLMGDGSQRTSSCPFIQAVPEEFILVPTLHRVCGDINVRRHQCTHINLYSGMHMLIVQGATHLDYWL